MKYLDEFRDGKKKKNLSLKIHSATKQIWNIMEICGGQTHSILKYSVEEFLPDEIQLIHGPGCPVCVTPLELIDKAIAIAQKEDVIFTSFGDMLRVPGSEQDLFAVRAAGADVRVVYSPLDAIKIAQENRRVFQLSAHKFWIINHQLRMKTTFIESSIHVFPGDRTGTPRCALADVGWSNRSKPSDGLASQRSAGPVLERARTTRGGRARR